MRILIIGAGSIGTLFGAKLALKNHDIDVIANYNISKIINESNFQFKDLQGNITKIHHLYALNTDAKHEELKKFDYDFCIISSKAYDLDVICLNYSKILSKIKSLILLQNGIGNEEKIYEYYPNLNVFRLITSIGAFLTEKGVVEQRGDGKTYICQKNSEKFDPIFPEIRTFIEILNNSGIKTQWHPNGNEIIWEKAMINICINSIGALTHHSNGEILNIENIDEIFKLILNEAYQIALKMKIQLISLDLMIDLVKNVLKMTSQNNNSMFQDILNNKSTEIKFLNGKIVELGKKYKIETPINFLLTKLIESI